jgi:hypothetical protein
MPTKPNGWKNSARWRHRRTEKPAGPLPPARCAAAKARRNPGAHWKNRWPRARRSKNTTRWKKICARNGRTELTAAVEAEYRRQRADLLLLVQWWLRDVWLHTLAAGKDLLNFPKITGAEAVAGRLSSRQALENLQTLEQTQRLLHSNVQEALALEVGLLKLHF